MSVDVISRLLATFCPTSCDLAEKMNCTSAGGWYTARAENRTASDSEDLEVALCTSVSVRGVMKRTARWAVQKSGARATRALASSALLCVSVAVSNAAPPDPLAVAFGTMPALWNVRLSPDGTKVSFLQMHPEDLSVAQNFRSHHGRSEPRVGEYAGMDSVSNGATGRTTSGCCAHFPRSRRRRARFLSRVWPPSMRTARR